MLLGMAAMAGASHSFARRGFGSSFDPRDEQPSGPTKHDLDRLAAAQAKRERKLARRSGRA